jgi:hypothetical protein
MLDGAIRQQHRHSRKNDVLARHFHQVVSRGAPV